jgi:hypothetical protein
LGDLLDTEKNFKLIKRNIFKNLQSIKDFTEKGVADYVISEFSQRGSGFSAWFGE